MKLYVIHGTVHWTVKSRETGATESGTRRPTIAIEASSEQAALNKARKQQKEAIGTDYWPCVSLTLIAELVNVRPTRSKAAA
jgi:hypothetical protein